MNIYPEIPCSKIKIIDRDKDGKPIPEKKYFVREYGLNGVVLEVELIPIPNEKITRTIKEDGTEDIAKRITEEINLFNEEK